MAVSRRRSAVPLATKILIALRFFAAGSYQMDIASNKFFQVNRNMSGNCIRAISSALIHANVIAQWVRFPNTLEELNIIRQQFYHEYGFPEVIGCIDCTHVAIVPPPQEIEHEYVNRKNYHSLNCQLICDHKMRILSANCRFPGRTHDAFIWQNSAVRDVVEQLSRQHEGYYLLGDSGYLLRPWLLTTLRGEQQPETPEHAYNIAHKRTS